MPRVYKPSRCIPEQSAEAARVTLEECSMCELGQRYSLPMTILFPPQSVDYRDTIRYDPATD
jgi:hypothetical protein